MLKKELLERITIATEILLTKKIHDATFYIGGASALSLFADSFRATNDIDIVKWKVNDRHEEIRQILRTNYINDHVMTSVDPNLVENYGYPVEISFDEPIVQSGNIKWFIVYPEVVILSKSIINERTKDKDDLEYGIASIKLSKERATKVLASVKARRTEEGVIDPDWSHIESNFWNIFNKHYKGDE